MKTRKVLLLALALIMVLSIGAFAGISVSAEQEQNTDFDYEVINDNDGNFVGINIKESLNGAFKMKVSATSTAVTNLYGIVTFEFDTPVDTSLSDGLLMKFAAGTKDNYPRIFIEAEDGKLYRTVTSPAALLRNDVLILENGTA